MSLRPSRRLAMAFSLLIVVMMIVSAPVMALADSGDSQAPTEPPGNSASATSQSTTPPGPPEGAGNSASAPGQTGTTAPANTSAPADPGNSGDAPGHNKTDTSTTQSPPAQSNAGGNSASGGGATSNAGGNSGKPTTTGGGSSVPGSHQGTGTSGTPKGKGDGPTTGVGGNCDGDPSLNNGNGANTSGDFDNTCSTSGSGPAPNGNGGGGAKGKPCAGCVGNADDKNPPGQSHRPEDKNKGYECDGNKGVGKGNPAHTGCQPPPCPSGYTLTVSISSVNGGTGTTNPTVGNHTGLSSPITTVTAAGTNGSVATPTSQSVSYVNCVGSANVTFTKSQDCPNGFSLTVTTSSVKGGTGSTNPPTGSHSYPSNPVTTVTASGSNGSTASPASQTVTYSNCHGSAHVTFSRSSECQVNCGPPPIVDCDGDGIDDNVDNNLKDCEPPPPGEDCDGDGVPDNLDTDLSECEPEVRPDLCPDGSEMPESGICDEVLGEIIEKDPKPVFPGGPVVAGEVLGVPEVQPAAVLPFTGGNLLPFLIVSMSLMGVGGSVVRRRGTATTEREAA